MLAYNSQTLDNLEIKEAAEKALRKDCISAATYKAIETAHPVNFYTPNPIIKVGLFILTTIIVSFSLGLLTLMLLEAIKNESGFAGLCIFAGLACYGALELFIREKKLFRAGVDDALLWSALGLICSSAFITNHPSVETVLGLVFITTFVATLRFADMVVASVCYLAFLGLIFNIAVKLGPAAKIITPFLIMGISLAVYIAAKKIAAYHFSRHYHHCLTAISVLSLLTLYLAGNYFVVRELSDAMFDLQLKEGESIPGALFFWIYTVVIPVVYLYLGIRHKNAVLLRTGMILLAAIVFTIRYYHSVMPLETAMTLGGLVLTVAAWALIRYLKEPKHGFTYEESEDPSLADKLRLESLIIAQTYTPGAQPAGNDMQYGGGSGGGGGASGDY
ncbi:hypothetical protein [Chitinophaga arvensicola]|uniref:DUF4401 domain-containing protein n=1 Tax=Chitinophaga arvensicola TaxID=29529 RepID=A0A1I0SC16_9BACT|nr:hypothetical protein [Chitinophaga arvensicola]SEW54438.1 hypothetical protein SAMN04488122_6032 [Chitinophaga arvensicola]